MSEDCESGKLQNRFILREEEIRVSEEIALITEGRAGASHLPFCTALFYTVLFYSPLKCISFFEIFRVGGLQCGSLACSLYCCTLIEEMYVCA
jgi:hypothetical protein